MELAYKQNPPTRDTSTETYVYSLGEARTASAMQIPQDGCQPYPTRMYDTMGRLINMDHRGEPVIIQYSDGSAIKTLR